MRWRMLFRIGVTVVVVSAVILFYLNNILNNNALNSSRDKISQLVRSENLAFEEALGHLKNGKRQGWLDDDDEVSEHKLHHRGDDDVGGGEDRGKDVDDEKSDDMNSRLRNADGGRGGKEDVPPPSVEENEGMDNGGGKPFLALQSVHKRVGRQVHTQVHIIHLAVVACGDRGEETVVLLKSAAILTTSTPLVFHIFAEKELHSFFVKQLDHWPEEVLDVVEYRIYNISFPDSDTQTTEEWKKLFKPCASQRLFIPSLLHDVDSLIYVDTDVLFLSPLTKLWAFFSHFNSTQAVALAPEHEDPGVGWYNRFARHPFVPPLGVNSGVMLMNLTRLRRSEWLPSLIKHHKDYKLKITWGDQDLINIYFHFHPEELYIYTCDWNYRPDHCMYMSVCRPAEQHGAFVLHGSRRVMHNDKHPAFKAIYTAFRNYGFGQGVGRSLLASMEYNLNLTSHTNCGQVPHIFLKQVQEFVMETGEGGQ